MVSLSKGAQSRFQSMGMPPEMQQAVEDAEAAKKKAAKAAVEEPVEEELSAEDVEGLPTDADADKVDPVRILKRIGITLTEQDIHSVVFKGELEKEGVPLLKLGERNFNVTLKTLTGEDYELVDELLAEEIEVKKITNGGFDTRRGMWILAFGVTKINGQPIRNFKKDQEEGRLSLNEDGTPDLKDKARLTKESLSKLNAAVITKMMRYHSQFALAINHIIGDLDNPLSSLP